MDDEARAQIEQATREDDIARAYREDKRNALFQVIQDILTAKRATPAELAELTPFGAERVRQIGKGRWHRTRNVDDSKTGLV